MENTVILITSNGIGNGDPALQQTLVAKYLELVNRDGYRPNALCFYTEGVKLVCEGSTVLEHLRSLEAAGTRLIICSTCLNYYHLTDKVQVGIVGGMGDIIEAQKNAEKVITL